MSKVQDTSVVSNGKRGRRELLEMSTSNSCFRGLNHCQHYSPTRRAAEGRCAIYICHTSAALLHVCELEITSETTSDALKKIDTKVPTVLPRTLWSNDKKKKKSGHKAHLPIQ